MASNRDAVAEELQRRKGNGTGPKRSSRPRYQEEDYADNLPDVDDPQVPDILAAARNEVGDDFGPDDFRDEDDGTTDFQQWEDNEEDDGWDGSTAPRRGSRNHPQQRGQRGQQRGNAPQDFDEEALPENIRQELMQARQLNALYTRNPDALIEMAKRRSGASPYAQGYGQQGFPAPVPGYGNQPGYVPVQPPLQIGQHQITAEEWSEMTTPEKLAWEMGHQFHSQLPQQFARIEQEVERANLHRDFHTERLQTMVEAIAEELLGIKLDAADTGVIDRLLDQGYDMKTAVKEGYGKRLRQKLQAAKKGRPRTPANRPGGRDRLGPNASLYEVEEYYRQHGRLPDD